MPINFFIVYEMGQTSTYVLISSFMLYMKKKSFFVYIHCLYLRSDVQNINKHRILPLMKCATVFIHLTLSHKNCA